MNVPEQRQVPVLIVNVVGKFLHRSLHVLIKDRETGETN